MSELARKLGCRPRDISDLFYGRQLDDSACPVVGGRRLVPDAYVPAVREALQKAGKLGELVGANA